MPLASWLTTVIALSIPLSSTAFDFDDEDLSVPVSSSPSHAGDDDVAELTSVVLSHAIGDVDLAPRNKLFFKPPKGAETVGGSVAIRVGQGRLDSTALEALKAVAKQGGVYTIALPSVLSDPNSPPVIASASACAILASRFEERLQLTMTSRDRVAALSYILPTVPARCPSGGGLPRLALDEVLFNTTAAQIFPREGPRPYGKIPDAAFLPPAAAAAAAKAAQASGADGKGADGASPPPENQSFLRKYWMYILPIVLVMSSVGADPPPDGKGGEGGGGEGGARPAAAARRK